MGHNLPRRDRTCQAACVPTHSPRTGMWSICSATDNTGMAPPYRERRKYLRRPVLLNCRIEGTTIAGPLQITDLSESGCFIATSHPLKRDSQITFFVTLAGDEIRIIGRVVRVEPGRGVGVEINLNLLSQYARLALEDFLREPAAPSGSASPSKAR